MPSTPEDCESPVPALRPSSVLDGLIHQRLVGHVIFMGGSCFTGRHAVPAYSSSIDAASSLIARLLPGWEWRVGCNTEETVVELSPGPGTTVRVSSPKADELSPGLAICIALFAVLEAVEHGDEPEPARGVSALQGLLALPADEFGRRALVQLDVETLHDMLEMS